MEAKTQANFSLDKELVSGKGVAVLAIHGDVDAHTASALQTALSEIFNAKQYKIAVDMADVNYMSSAGAGILLVMQSEAKEHKGDLVLVKPAASVRYVMDLLGLSARFQIVENREKAIAALCR